MNNPILYRGTLTLERLKELSAQHLSLKDSSDSFNPSKNPKAISLIEQIDGNWIGQAFKYSKLIEIRAGDPNTVLMMLQTHNGK